MKDGTDDGQAKKNNAETVDENTRKANRYFLKKVLINSFLILFGTVVISSGLTILQRKSAMRRQEQDSKTVLQEVIVMMRSNAANAAELKRIYHEGNQHTVVDLKRLLTSGLFGTLSSEDVEARTAVAQDIQSRSNVSYFFIMDKNGRVVFSPVKEYNETLPSLLELGLLSEKNLDLLLSGTALEDGSIHPASEENETGSYYFYSTPIDGTPYYLVIGCNISDIDMQLSSLNDYTLVLKKTVMKNNGFLFAADSVTGDFIFYENGSEVLTGQNALQAGLSAGALEDGFSGVQTINGTRYYCVSRSYEGKTIICAVAAADELFSGNKYVLFWSISAFVLVMILCIVYAVIVRNDFVNKKTETNTVTLFQNKKTGFRIRYNHTLLLKILPVMLIGTAAVFFITFYTQTLLEISNAVEECSVSVREMESKYEESTETREAVTAYYNNSYLAKARVLSYLLETEVSALNEPTEFIHADYDASNVKHYLKDNEGNPLRSVAHSEKLMKYCRENGLKEIYLFDDNGRVIATSGDIWYFRMSHASGDQSNEFLDVLDGKKDYLIQDPQVNEVGVHSQYIGVVFYYFTTRDEAGNTKYVSRLEYDRAGADSGITKHRSLLQIGLPEEIAAKMLATTDLDYVFSADTLVNGFMELYDATDEHRVLYSKFGANVGKPAADVGVTEKAFSGEYYGFRSIGGRDYFQYFVYENFGDGYYISASTPKSNMYQFRFKIALITAAVCLLHVLLLSATITLTTDEEDRLYATVSEKFKNSHNASTFTVRVGGKQTTTVSAVKRWDSASIPWEEKSPEQKLIVIVGWILKILLIFLILAVLGAKVIFPESSIILYIISGNWDRGLNVFSLTACFMLLVFVAFITAAVRCVVKMVTSAFGARSETVGHLVVSIIKYGGALAALYYCLYLLGFDATNLVASAGILSLVIGLGAQSLIKDILAGISIVFEGEFRVGDIVTIGDTRGTIMDIGLRTTKMLVVGGNVKIYNNSDISNVLNMTKQESVATCTIGIAYGQEISHVEEILHREMPEIRKKHKEIHSGPTFIGVTELSASSVDLVIIAGCAERDIMVVQRILNREILEIFYRNGIEVPFNQVTVHMD